MTKDVPKYISMTFTLPDETAAQEMEDFKNRHGFKDEAEAVQFAYRFALNVDIQHGITFDKENNMFHIGTKEKQ
jgi:hypothetical protein